jgi:hypothetical protein
MIGLVSAVGPARPRCDGRRVLFELNDQGRSIACAISLGALRDLNGMRGDRAAALLECFVAARGRIEAIARDKHRTRSAGVCGTLHIWSDDIDGPPDAGAPAVALPARPRRIA